MSDEWRKSAIFHDGLWCCESERGVLKVFFSGPSFSLNAVGGFSTPIGWIPDGEYQEYKIALKPGNRVFIYSDGITDCLFSRNEALSQKSLEFILENYCKRPLKNLMEFLEKKSENLGKCGTIEDDISLLALEIN
ncbi:MAG: SpoIIE family protein phosphatase [Nitrospinae bacterium]|nr:SpoIIE family protein phosphatase [Nitrospinota bacterium]